MAIGIRKRGPLYDRMTPEEQAVLDAPNLMPETEQGFPQMRIGIPYLQGAMPPDAGIDEAIDAEAAQRRAQGVTSVGPRFEAPAGMMMRNEAGRGTPLIRSDRPYFAPGTMLAAAPEADPYAVTPEMLAQQQQSLAVMDGQRSFPDSGVEDRRKEYLAGNTKFQDARAKRVGIQQERQAAVTEKAKDRMMSPQQRGTKQFIQSVDLDDEVAANMALGPEYAKYNQQKFANADTTRRTGIAERDVADQEARTRMLAEAPDPAVAKIAVEDTVSNVPATLRGNVDETMRPAINGLTRAVTAPDVAGFFNEAPLDYLLRNQGVTRQFAPQILQKYGAEALLKALGGEYSPLQSVQGALNPSEALLKQANQQNLVRKLLGLPGFPALPEPAGPGDPRFGHFQGIGPR